MRKLITLVMLTVLFIAAVTIYKVATGAGNTEPWRVPAPSHPGLKTATQPAAPPGEGP